MAVAFHKAGWHVFSSISRDIYLGKHSASVRLASLLPVGFTDHIMQPMVGLDVGEQKLQEQKKAKKEYYIYFSALKSCNISKF